MLDAIKNVVGQTNRHMYSPHLKMCSVPISNSIERTPIYVFINLIFVNVCF